MNKHFKQLAKKAYAEDALSLCPDWEYSGITSSLLNELDGFLANFAKSIIDECVKESERISNCLGDGDWYGGYSAGASCCVENLKTLRDSVDAN